MNARVIGPGRVARGRVRPPGSKSLSNRALVLALLARQPIGLTGLLESEDLLMMRRALAALGVQWQEDHGEATLRPGPLPATAEINCHQSGTMARLMAGALAALPGCWRLDGAPRLRERPMAPIIAALRQLEVTVEELGQSGHLPLRIHGRLLPGGSISVDAGESSQYLSGLLLAGLLAEAPLEIEATALTSQPYIDVTLAAVSDFGGTIERQGNRFRVQPGLNPPPCLAIEVDASSAVYPAAAAALTGGEVVIEGLRATSVQADREAFELLARMGAEIEWGVAEVRVRGTGTLVALDADLSRVPDQVPTFAALAPFAQGVTRLRGVAHLRLKESDRLAAMRTELFALGVPVLEHQDGLEIPGVWSRSLPPTDPVEVSSWDDHRIAMSLALVGLRRPGVSIANPEVVAKSWPGFWEMLEALLLGA